VTLEHQQKYVRLLICAGIAAATLIAYEPIRHNGFVNYDDNRYIIGNPQVTGGITLESLGEAFTKPHYFMWHPLTTISHMADCQLFGLNPAGHHFVSVAIHIINALLLFWIISNLSGTVWLGAFIAGVFALHPIQVESVAWAAERKTVLSGLFWLLTMAAYIHYARQPKAGRYLLVLLVFGLCIMTKPVVVTLPFVLLLLDYWPLERIRTQNKEHRIQNAEVLTQGASLKWLIIEKMPLLGMSVFLSIMTFIMQRQGGVIETMEKMPLDYRAANMFLSYIRYIGKMIIPSKLAVSYPHPSAVLSDAPVVICAILFIVLTILSIYTGRRKKYAAVGWLWFVGTLVPMIGLVQSGAQAMANRYMYISMIGLLIIIAWAAKDFVTSRPRMKIVAAILAAVLLSALTILTRIQLSHWQNSMTLYEYALKVTKNNALVENNYGSALLEAGRLDDAVLHLNEALSIVPGLGEAEENLGIIYLKQRKADKAAACFGKALESNKTSAELYSNLGSAYIQAGKFDLAIENLTKSIELKPNNIDALNKLAWLYAAIDNASIHNTQKAVEFAQRGCELTGYKDPMLLDTLAVTYAAAGRFDEAKATAQKALNIAKETKRESLAVEIEKRIKLYEAGQPYLQK
jgi:Tfp pilus assembly protein PilF